MEQKELKINIPEGYEIDKENSTFECIKFKPVEKELPKTWEEFCETHPREIGEAWINERCDIEEIKTSDFKKFPKIPKSDRNLLPSREYAEAMLALCQLIQLRDCYNDGWIPDWTDKNNKCVIFVEYNCIRKAYATSLQRILAFKSASLRNKFFENFRDLIEIAKPLL